MYIPPMTQTLAMRIEFGDIHYFIARTKALAQLQDAPFKAEVRQFGSAIAFMVEETNNPIFNRVTGANDETINYLDEIIHWYQSRQKNCRFDIIPSNANKALLPELAKRRFYHAGFTAALYGSATTEVQTLMPAHVSIQPVLSGDRELMADIYVTGFSFSAKTQPVMKSSLKALFDAPNVHFYSANIDDKMVGLGVLFISDSIGYLASTTILQPYRNQGYHQALIYHRIAEAALEQCDLVVAHVGFGSISQRNLERAGMRLAYTKALWQPLENK